MLALVTRLVREAPALDAVVIAELVAALDADGSPLATSIAHVVRLVAAGRVDPGIALPHLAMATATLCDPRLGDREREAARYEIDTLQPVPARPASASGGAASGGGASEVIVAVDQLIRGPRPRT